MISWWLIAWRFARKNWLPLLLFAIIMAATGKYFSMKLKISHQKTQIIECQLTSDRLVEERNVLVERITQQNEAVTQLQTRGEEYERELAELRSTPPAAVVEYRDKIVEVDRVIVSEVCPDAIEEAAKLIKEGQNEN
jgi:hypothetical protein